MENDDVAPPMPAMTRQQIYAALSVSGSTIRRLEPAGPPYTPVALRSKRYDLDECKAWLRSHYGAAVASPFRPAINGKWRGEKVFVAKYERAQRRISPSS